MFIHSIRWRLQLWLAFLLACVLSGFGVAVHRLYHVNVVNRIDEELARRVAVLSSAARRFPGFWQGPTWFPFGGMSGRPDLEEKGPRPLGKRGRPEGGPGEGRRETRGPRRDLSLSDSDELLFGQDGTNGFYYAAWGADRLLVKRSTNAPPDLPMPERPRDALTHTRMRGACRESFYFTGLGDCVLAGRSIARDLEGQRRFGWWLFGAGFGILSLGLGGGWWLTNRAIRPVDEISTAATRISAGNLAERINGADVDNELGRLAGVLNSTFARLDAAFAQQQQFTADASHELRTPLTVIISEAQTALARERSAAEYRETVEACLDAAQQMRRLTESLLELARFDAGREQIVREPVDLAEEARLCIKRLQPLAATREIQVHSDLASAQTLGDPTRLGQVIANLLSNAIHYNKDRGEVRVATRLERNQAVISVSDTGQGIAAEDLPRVFERFYRADKSRARPEGRNGLGLAIAKAIVDAHGGSIEVSSEPGVGSTFTVRLPV